jgi:regulator of sirC expression with transglutaminase-like and TPR domain
MANLTGPSLEDQFRAVLQGDESALELDLGAYVIASLVAPPVAVSHYLSQLDQLAQRVAARSQWGFRLGAQSLLFDELGFAGNEDDYYNPRNSCLPWVLASKRGIPITLSALYIEVARRLGVPVHGIAAPGHFLVRLQEDGEDFYIDPFRRGKIRDDIAEDLPAPLRSPAPKQIIFLRMLNNLRQIYLLRRNWEKASAILTYILTADPHDGDALRQRSAARAGLQQFRGAASDLELFLRLEPQHPEAKALEEQLSTLRRMHASTN